MKWIKKLFKRKKKFKYKNGTCGVMIGHQSGYYTNRTNKNTFIGYKA
jgi:hypothetical protein